MSVYSQHVARRRAGHALSVKFMTLFWMAIDLSVSVWSTGDAPLAVTGPDRIPGVDRVPGAARPRLVVRQLVVAGAGIDDHAGGSVDARHEEREDHRRVVVPVVPVTFW